MKKIMWVTRVLSTPESTSSRKISNLFLSSLVSALSLVSACVNNSLSHPPLKAFEFEGQEVLADSLPRLTQPYKAVFAFNHSAENLQSDYLPKEFQTAQLKIYFPLSEAQNVKNANNSDLLKQVHMLRANKNYIKNYVTGTIYFEKVSFDENSGILEATVKAKGVMGMNMFTLDYYFDEDKLGIEFGFQNRVEAPSFFDIGKLVKENRDPKN